MRYLCLAQLLLISVLAYALYTKNHEYFDHIDRMSQVTHRVEHEKNHYWLLYTAELKQNDQLNKTLTEEKLCSDSLMDQLTSEQRKVAEADKYCKNVIFLAEDALNKQYGSLLICRAELKDYKAKYNKLYKQVSDYESRPTHYWTVVYGNYRLDGESYCAVCMESEVKDAMRFLRSIP